MHFSRFDSKPLDRTIPSPPSTWTPPRGKYTQHLEEYTSTITKNAIDTIHNTRPFYDLEARIFRNTLSKLRNLPDIIIKPADKNVGLAILDETDYVNMCMKHLNDTSTYALTLHYSSSALFAKLRMIMNKHHLLYTNDKNRTLTTLAKALLQLDKSPLLRVPPFKCLPKLHKRSNPPYDGRPIVSTPSSPTYYASVYLDRVLLPLVKKLPHICFSSRQVVKDMLTFNDPSTTCIFTADVHSLYPSIPITLGIEYTRRSIRELSDFSPAHIDFIIDLLTWVLTNNYCIFDNRIYLQIQGTAMGSPVAVAYANLFLYQVEKPIIPMAIYYRRYIDDLLALFIDEYRAQSFLTLYDTHCESISLDDNHTGPSGVFLDITLTLNQGRVDTCIFQKAINKYSYIPPISHHNPSMFPSFILEEFKRYKLICTHRADYLTTANLFEDRLIRRGYSPNMIALVRTQVPARATLTLTLTPNPNPNPNGRPIMILGLPKLFPTPKWKELFKVSQELASTLEYRLSYSSPSPVIGSRNPPNVAHIITSSLYPAPKKHKGTPRHED